MRNRGHIETVCSYILDQDHEYENVVRCLFEYSEGQTREQMRDHARSFTWYSAVLLLHGKREAEKAVTQAIKEALYP